MAIADENGNTIQPLRSAEHYRQMTIQAQENHRKAEVDSVFSRIEKEASAGRSAVRIPAGMSDHVRQALVKNGFSITSDDCHADIISWS